MALKIRNTYKGESEESKVYKFNRLIDKAKATPDIETDNIEAFWLGTQAEYDAIVTKSDSTIYFIK